MSKPKYEATPSFVITMTRDEISAFEKLPVNQTTDGRFAVEFWKEFQVTHHFSFYPSRFETSLLVRHGGSYVFTVHHIPLRCKHRPQQVDWK